ncbi:MAG: TM0106 family RecB-like putative nuclease [Candidatus Riflebacteria bacterium]|nr:TM0106 family RecB-like putative nuclease [Candidatus Riflebacteria bacterium]
MFLSEKGLVFCAGDLLDFLGCKYACMQDCLVARHEKTRPASTADADVITEAGLKHEKKHLQSLKEKNIEVFEIPQQGTLDERVELTKQAMREGKQVIYQAAFYTHPWNGFADFLIRTDKPSKLGDYSYYPLDTKLKRTATAEHLIQLSLYADLIAEVQGNMPSEAHLITGDGAEVCVSTKTAYYYFKEAKKRLERYMANLDLTLEPEPCAHCGGCTWIDECEQIWENKDHLCRIANIRKSQIKKLRESGINTLTELVELEDNYKIKKLSPNTFQKIKKQATLQKHKESTGESVLEVLPLEAGQGFNRLPKPDLGDLFFDMEGDPLYSDGLEYLFGVYLRSEGEDFKAFWGHNHDEEKLAFEGVMRFFGEHLKKYPNAHIYHYNHYEETALKRLSSRYGVCEDQVDDFLRRGTLVDLYKVVREGIMTSERGYSIKDLECFYMEKRAGDVKNATQSIVFYEEWRNTGDSLLLKQIEDYNYDDCKSTALCLDWLLGVRPGEAVWFERKVEEKSESEEIKDDNAHITMLKEGLGVVAADKRSYMQLLIHLCDFHRRENKPQWWKLFDMADAAVEDLIEDSDCLGGLKETGEVEPVKRSVITTFRYPEQETKIQIGQRPLLAGDMSSAGTVEELDLERRLIKLKRGANKGPYSSVVSLLPPPPIDNKILRKAVLNFAKSYLAEHSGESAQNGDSDGADSCSDKAEGLVFNEACGLFIERKPPVLSDSRLLEACNNDDFNDSESIVKAILGLNKSVLFIQGPPGCGKTHHAARIILSLLKAGKRIGVTSNSHKAIGHLLKGVQDLAIKEHFVFKGAKKCTNGDSETYIFPDTLIKNFSDANSIDVEFTLVAGTAWLFSRPEHFNKYDYLFVDEAGQVSLANLIAVGQVAANIVLLGDQMQLNQPIQGVHPEKSGVSALEYMLEGGAVVPADRGVFLSKSWRMHPHICSFISSAVYEDRLSAHPKTSRQRISYQSPAPYGLKECGIQFLPVEHSGCSQSSEEEGAVINELIKFLTSQKYVDGDGEKGNMELGNIMVITPYNAQVNYLKSILPDGTAIGTVDKFQGQEAEVVLFSMVTSSSEEMPRNIEFLFSRNRLNVAVSRAKTLVVILASPRLLEIPCNSIEQLSLVNTLCHLKYWAEAVKISE